MASCLFRRKALANPFSVTERIFELREKGLVVEAGKKSCKIIGPTVLAWRVKEQENTLFYVAQK
jgi:hypothetical protein